MALKYNVIEIFTSEEVHWHGKPLYDAVVQHVSSLRIAARCIVSRGIAGCYETGELASRKIEVLMYNMPLKIEVILPAPELDRVLPGIEEMVVDGIVVVEEMEIRSHRTKQRLIPRHLRVRDVMTTSPRSVSPSTPVSDVVRLLLSSDFGGAPVVDAEGRPVGIVTEDDLISRGGMPVRLGLLALLEAHRVDEFLQTLTGRTAEDVMTRPVTTVEQDEMLTEAVNVMLRKRLKRLPVVDANGVLVGILSRIDIFHTVTRETPDWNVIRKHDVILSGVKFVRDIMRSDMHTVRPDTPVEEVIRTIDENDIQRVAVVDENGRLLGVISDSDLLAAFSDHPAGLWDYLVSKLPFMEVARRHRELLEHVRARTAEEIMTRDVVTVTEDTPVNEAIALMAERRIKRLPVVDPKGTFRGVISRDSLLREGVVQ